MKGSERSSGKPDTTSSNSCSDAPQPENQLYWRYYSKDLTSVLLEKWSARHPPGTSGQAGYQCLLACTNNDVRRKLRYLNSFHDQNVDGIILIGTFTHCRTQRRLKHLVSSDRDPGAEAGYLFLCVFLMTTTRPWTRHPDSAKPVMFSAISMQESRDEA